MAEYRFTVPGRPVPAARMTRRGKWLRTDAMRYLAFKDQVGWCARKCLKEPLTGDLAVELYAYWCGGRPADVDNLAKSVLDGCNRIAWIDDSQIVELHAYRLEGKPQRTEVIIKELKGRNN